MSDNQIYVELTNRWARFLGYYPEELSKFFSYKKPGYWHSPAYKQFNEDGSRVWDGSNKMIKYRKLSSGLFLAMRKEAEAKLGISFEITDHRVRPKFREAEDASDRSYQVECNTAMISASRTGGIILCATGTGKTFIAGKYFQQLIGYGVFIVDELTLLEQTKDELEAVMGEKVGKIGNSIFAPQRITVATIQTLHKHRKDRRFNQWRKKLVIGIVDELHAALSKRNLSTLTDIQFQAIFGLTATLQLGQKMVRMKAFAMCGKVIYTYPLSAGVDDGFLTPGVVIGVDIHREEREDDGDEYPDAYSTVIVRGRRWNRPIRSLVREAIRRDYCTLVIVQRVRHVKKLTRIFKERGIRCRAVFGEKSTPMRRKAIRLFESSKIDVIVTNKVFQKGTNIKRLGVIVDGTAAKDANAALQKFGRGVRIHAEKKGLIYFHLAIKALGGNRFKKAGAVHRSAFKKAGILVKPLPWSSAAAAFDMAEKKLKRVLRELKARRQK